MIQSIVFQVEQGIVSIHPESPRPAYVFCWFEHIHPGQIRIRSLPPGPGGLYLSEGQILLEMDFKSIGNTKLALMKDRKRNNYLCQGEDQSLRPVTSSEKVIIVSKLSGKIKPIASLYVINKCWVEFLGNCQCRKHHWL